MGVKPLIKMLEHYSRPPIQLQCASACLGLAFGFMSKFSTYLLVQLTKVERPERKPHKTWIPDVELLINDIVEIKHLIRLTRHGLCVLLEVLVTAPQGCLPI